MADYYFKMDDMAVGYQGKTLIHDINIGIDKGEIVTLIGPNGSGKSTILKSITKQLKLIGGKVFFDDTSLQEMSYKELSSNMAVVLTERIKTELMTCHEIVATGRYPYTGRLGILTSEDERIVDEAMKVLDQTAKVYGHSISYTQLLMGGASIDVNGVPLTEETLQLAKDSDAVLMGSIGGDAKTSPWYQLEPSKRPEAGLLQLRKGLNLFANLRPAVLYDELKGACPLKKEIADRGFDLMIMRELTGGLYFGKRSTEEIDGVLTAKDELTYNENEIRRIAKRGFDIAMKRNKKVTSVDKANVLDSSRLWRKVVEEVAKDYPEVTLEHMLVDNCAMQLVKDPAQFDVVLTENMFGDILSDEASMVTGSIGMLASASLNDTKFGLYEPSGGSAPDIAGKGIANPIATILSAAMMLRFSFDLDKEADAIENAVAAVLKDGYRTIDIMSEGKEQIGTAQMGDKICEYIK
mgnify:CR=1 FL=1